MLKHLLLALVVGTGAPETCTDAALRTALDAAALQGGASITFNCGSPSMLLTLDTPIVIPDRTVLNGGDVITLAVTDDPLGTSFETVDVEAGSTVMLEHINFFGGEYPIVNQGTLILDTSLIFGWYEHSIFNSGNLTVKNSTVIGQTFYSGVTPSVVNLGNVACVKSTFVGGQNQVFDNQGTFTLNQCRFVAP